MVSLKSKLLFLPLYLDSLVQSLARLASSLPQVFAQVCCRSITCGSIACGYMAYRYIVCGYMACGSITQVGCGSVALLIKGFQSVFWFTGVLRSVTQVLGMLWPVRLIPKLLRFIERIWLSRLSIRPVILLSLGEAERLFMALTQFRIFSLVYSIWSSSYIMLYKDRATVTCLSFLTHTPW